MTLSQAIPHDRHRRRLTAYDACLEIAMGGNYALATADDDLRRAAIAEGVPVL